MPKIRVNDIDIYYELKGEGFPLVMIMGLSANIDWWPPEMVERLAEHYKVLLFDNRGSGRTDSPEMEYSISMMAKDTAGLMAELGIERAHLFGISMGGMIAQEMALSHAHRVEKLILGCTNCGHQNSVPASPEVLNLLINQTRITPEEMLKILFPVDYISRNIETMEKSIKRYLIAPISPEAFMRQLSAIMNFNSYDRLPEITTPTLIITGDQDILIPPENSEILAGAISKANLVLLKGCGHGFPTQAPDLLFDYIRQFLESFSE